jgi:hypothetical protein
MENQELHKKSKERAQVPSGVSRITEFCRFSLDNFEQTPDYFEESALPSPYPILVCEKDEAKLHRKFPGRHITTFDKLRGEMYEVSLDLMGMTPEAKKKLSPVTAYGGLSSLGHDMERWSKEAFNGGVKELALPVIFEPVFGRGILSVNLKVNYLIYNPDQIKRIVELEPEKTDPEYMFKWNDVEILGNYKKMFIVGIKT